MLCESHRKVRTTDYRGPEEAHNGQYHIDHKDRCLCYYISIDWETVTVQVYNTGGATIHTPLDTISDISIVSQQGTATCWHCPVAMVQ